ncbi:MAG: hypothetical protein WAW92_03715 [Minisyncoccia bacterium]
MHESNDTVPTSEDKRKAEIIAELKEKTAEEIEDSLDFQRVRDAVMNNFWEHTKRNEGRFILDEGISDVAKALNMTPGVIRQCIKESVTPECLTKIGLDGEGKTVSLVEVLKTNNYKIHCLLEVLSNLNNQIEIWTLGDKDWQEDKLRRSGADKFIDQDHIHVVEGEKISELRKIFDEISARETEKPIHAYVVDDSSENIKSVKALHDEYSEKGVEVHNYHLKLDDKSADTTAFYKWIKQERETNPNLILILDFDQVIADTNGALRGQACDNIYRIRLAERYNQPKDLPMAA